MSLELRQQCGHVLAAPAPLGFPADGSQLLREPLELPVAEQHSPQRGGRDLAT